MSLDADGRLEVRSVEPPAEPAIVTIAAALPATKSEPSRFQRWRELATNVTVISWVATLAVAGMVGVALFRPKRPPQKTSDRVAIKRPTERAETPILETPTEPEPSMNDVPEPSPPIVQAESTPDDEPIDALLVVESVDAQPADAGPLAGTDPSVPAEPPAVVAEPLPPVDFDQRLAQPLKSFRQDRAIPRRELLDLLEEMLGAPIRYDADELGDAAKRLDQKLSLDLSDITVGDLLAKVLDQTPFTYDRERDALRLRLKTDETPDTTK
jgi:hypothetical protein